MSYKAEAQQILEYGRLLRHNGLIAGFDGNLSIRIDAEKVLITPSGEPKGWLNEEDLILINTKGDKISGSKEPSSEAAMHLQVYKKRPEIMACCHAHPPYATAYAATGNELPKNTLPEMSLSVGDIPLTEYIPTGLAEEWYKLDKYIDTADAVLLRNHGVLTVGRNMKEAYFRMETVEHCAQIAYIGRQLGGLKTLDSIEINRLKKRRKMNLKGPPL